MWAGLAGSLGAGPTRARPIGGAARVAPPPPLPARAGARPRPGPWTGRRGMHPPPPPARPPPGPTPAGCCPPRPRPRPRPPREGLRPRGTLSPPASSAHGSRALQVPGGTDRSAQRGRHVPEGDAVWDRGQDTGSRRIRNPGDAEREGMCVCDCLSEWRFTDPPSQRGKVLGSLWPG